MRGPLRWARNCGGAATLSLGPQRSESRRGPLTLASLDLSPRAGRGEGAQALAFSRCTLASEPPNFSYVKRETRSEEDAERWWLRCFSSLFGFAKKGIWNAGRRRAATSAPWLVRRCLPRDPRRVRDGEEAARLPAFHHGSSQGVLLSLGAIRARLRGGFANAADMTAGLAATSSDAPRTPVVMPAGMMPGPPGSEVASPARGLRLSPRRPICLRDDVLYRAR